MAKRRRPLEKSGTTTQINVVYSSSRAAPPVRWRQLCPDRSVGFFGTSQVEVGVLMPLSRVPPFLPKNSQIRRN